MKRIYMAMAALLVACTGFAQADTSKIMTDTLTGKIDTIRVGNFIIIKKSRNNETGSVDISIQHTPRKPGKTTTNWLIFDLGFANVNDRTDYSAASLRDYVHAPLTKDDFKLSAIKSSNVNIWVVMQKLKLNKGSVNLKYGVGLEMFNLRYQRSVNYEKDPYAYIFMDSVKFKKNKLYAGYATIPFMLNINIKPGKKKALTFSAGISAGYLIGSHDKQISGERGKDKTHGDIGLNQFRVAYIGEVGLGPVKLYGSYAMTKLHEKGLQQYPYTLGVRFSNW